MILLSLPKTYLLRASAFVVLVLAICGCGIIRKKQPDDSATSLAFRDDLSPEEAQELLEETGGNWLYGHGLGKTALNVSAIVLFPPYGLYLLGNGLLSVAGYEPLHVTDALPPETRKDYNQFYDGLTSVPGRISAELGEEEFRSEEVIKKRMSKYRKSNSGEGLTPESTQAFVPATSHTGEVRASYGERNYDANQPVLPSLPSGAGRFQREEF